MPQNKAMEKKKMLEQIYTYFVIQKYIKWPNFHQFYTIIYICIIRLYIFILGYDCIFLYWVYSLIRPYILILGYYTPNQNKEYIHTYIHIYIYVIALYHLYHSFISIAVPLKLN